MSSTWKSRLTLTLFGQSHGAAIGMTLDGLPAGETIDLATLQAFLTRRAPGNSPESTARKERDIPTFLSGLVNETTCGAPLTAIIENEDGRPEDYKNLTSIPRPGHADYTAHVKYSGHQDPTGGGHFSGRITAALCIAGGICLQILERRSIAINAHIASVGGYTNPDEIAKAIECARKANDSIGGVIECTATGLPQGLGDPMFDGMENRIAGLVFGIPAVRGLEFGTGFEAAASHGSVQNDPFYFEDGIVKTRTNNHGGILGGITSGMPLIFRTAIKPTPSIGRPQESVNLETCTPVTLEIKGRHDPCIVPRAVPCVEAAAAIAILDAMLEEGKS